MGKRKHYKLGKTERLCLPICLKDKVMELVRVLDNCKDPIGTLDRLIELAIYIKSKDEDSKTKS